MFTIGLARHHHSPALLQPLLSSCCVPTNAEDCCHQSAEQLRQNLQSCVSHPLFTNRFPLTDAFTIDPPHHRHSPTPLLPLSSPCSVSINVGDRRRQSVEHPDAQPSSRHSMELQMSPHRATLGGGALKEAESPAPKPVVMEWTQPLWGRTPQVGNAYMEPKPQWKQNKNRLHHTRQQRDLYSGLPCTESTRQST